MDPKTRKIGGGLLLMLKAAAVGVRRRGIQVCLVEKIAEKKTIVLILFQLEIYLRLELCLLQIVGMTATTAILLMNPEETASGHLGGVLKRKRRILEMIRGQMLRRMRLTATNKILALLAAQLPSVRTILAISGGHLLSVRMTPVISGGLAIVWKFILVDPLLTGVHLDLGQIEDVWTARMCRLLPEEEGPTIVGTYKLAGILLLLPSGPFLWIRIMYSAIRGENFLTFTVSTRLFQVLIPYQMGWSLCLH
jgi:hypothetical protein